MSDKIIVTRPEDFAVDLTKTPLNSVGDVLDEKYWLGIESAVNKCCERIWNIALEYKDRPLIKMSNEEFASQYLEKCEEDIFRIAKFFGDTVFAVSLDIYYGKVIGIEHFNVFNWTIANIHSVMKDELLHTVEKLRYINTKWVEKKNREFASLHRGALLTTEIKK